MANDPTRPSAVVYLSAMRPNDPTALCSCGNGDFGRCGPDEPWCCTACGKVRPVAESVQAAVAGLQLVYRCGCGSVTFRVGLAGLVCTECRTETSFDALFNSGKAPV